MDIRKLCEQRGAEGALVILGEFLLAELEKQGKEISDKGEVVDKAEQPLPVEEEVRLG